MKKLLPLTFVLSFSLAQPAMSADYFLAFGAGGEEEKVDTIFDPALREMGDYLTRARNVQGAVAMNGGHTTTEGIVREFPSRIAKSKFLATDYERLINEYSEKIKTMNEGDQLMVYIDSHGAEKDNITTSHRIATGAGVAADRKTLAGAQLVDLDKLNDLKKMAQAKHVKLAIIDASCHSGNTLSLADNNTCVISATGPNHYGYGPFSTAILHNLSNSKNLEEAFLKARATDQTPNFPMISTPAGLATNATVYDQLTPFFYHFDDKNDKLMPYMLSHSSPLQMCLANQSYNNLINTINNIEDLNTVTKKALFWNTKVKEVDLSQLKYLLGQYKKTQEDIALQMQNSDSALLKTEEKFDVKASNGNVSISYSSTVTWKDLLRTDYNKLIDQMSARVANATNVSEKIDYMGTLSFYAQAKAKKDEILKKYPQLANVKDQQDQIKKSVESSYYTNSAIAIEERKLYEALYKKNSTDPNVKGSNPCQDFKL